MLLDMGRMMMVVAAIVLVMLAGCGDDERSSEDGRAKTMAWIDADRARVLGELDANGEADGVDVTPCARASAWLTHNQWYVYEVLRPAPLPKCTYRYQVEPPCDDPYLTVTGPRDPDPTFLELCEEYLSDAEAECVVDAYFGNAAECCLRETPLYVPSEHNWSDAECDEGWYL